MPGIKNRGSQVHKSKKKYSRSKNQKEIDYEFSSSVGVSSFTDAYSLPKHVKQSLINSGDL